MAEQKQVKKEAFVDDREVKKNDDTGVTTTLVDLAQGPALTSEPLDETGELPLQELGGEHEQQRLTVPALLALAHRHYEEGDYVAACECSEQVYQVAAHRTDNLLLLGACHFQLRNFSESIFYNQQAIRIDPHFAESYGNLGNALKELGDLQGAIEFYLKALKLKPRFGDAYNNLASAYMQIGQTQQAM